MRVATSRASFSETRYSVWSVPKCLAMVAANLDSSKAGSSKPMVNVRTGAALTWRIKPTTSEERGRKFKSGEFPGKMEAGPEPAPHREAGRRPGRAPGTSGQG